ncbi:MAG TPA: LacI family DNA-binding transcriptional regulator [Bryobacteraceae bacterium]|jgi:LacI family transcriptional regulator|nr:LacI family DNA-binding transcriptional regulator [Bryobacteraceae bacterium]
MKDIARDLGVSVVTISKVLRNHGDISEETRQRVLSRMRELNYQPNYAARALVTGRTMSVGLVVPDLTHPFFAQVAQGLSAFLRTQRYGVLLASSEEDPELERNEIEDMLARHVDALIIASVQWNVETFRRIEERHIPYVLIDRQFAGLSANFVGADEEVIGSLATEHLISVGCRRIAHVRGPELSPGMGRYAGYKRALDRHRIDFVPEYVAMEETGDVAADLSGYKAMKALLETNPRPDGVFCYNDPSAMGAMQAVIERGLRVPQDVAVIGCGNVLYAQFLRVPLSSVDQNSAELGRSAGELALSLIGQKMPRPKTILLESKVIARESTIGRLRL